MHLIYWLSSFLKQKTYIYVPTSASGRLEYKLLMQEGGENLKTTIVLLKIINGEVVATVEDRTHPITILLVNMHMRYYALL